MSTIISNLEPFKILHPINFRITYVIGESINIQIVIYRSRYMSVYQYKFKERNDKQSHYNSHEV